MTWRHALSVTLWVAGALLLTLFNVSIASSQGLTLVAAYTADLPADDPASEAWASASAVEVPLSAQAVAVPLRRDDQIRNVTARALHDGTTLALLVEWPDESPEETVLRTEDFADGVAAQFALADGPPFVCMGLAGASVNIWHWRADWQADVAARADMAEAYPAMHVDQYPFTGDADPQGVGPVDYVDADYLPALASGNPFARAALSTPVQDLVAAGFGSLTAQSADAQNVSGRGAWAAGVWRVVFSRPLTSPDADDVLLASGRQYALAFAAWDGARAERDGIKSTSQWITLQLAPSPAKPEPDQIEAPAVVNEGLLWIGIPVLLTLALVIVGIPGLLLASRWLEKK